MYSKEKLLEMLSSEKASTRYDACEELRVSEESSPEIINALVNATQDEESWVAAKAKLALQVDVHHQMAINMGIIEPDKAEENMTIQTEITKNENAVRKHSVFGIASLIVAIIVWIFIIMYRLPFLDVNVTNFFWMVLKL
jgi:hypothetical protein